MKKYAIALYNDGNLVLTSKKANNAFEALKEYFKYAGETTDVNELISDLSEPDYIIEILEV